MRIAIVIVGIIALLVARRIYCGGNVENNSASVAQRLVLQQVLGGGRTCICSEVHVAYQFKRRDGYLTRHIAHFDLAKKTLRIEPDPGSGFAFGWDGVDGPTIRQVLQNGGQFSLFTKYRPNVMYVPSRMGEQF